MTLWARVSLTAWLTLVSIIRSLKQHWRFCGIIVFFFKEPIVSKIVSTSNLTPNTNATQHLHTLDGDSDNSLQDCWTQNKKNRPFASQTRASKVSSKFAGNYEFPMLSEENEDKQT